MTSLKQLKLSYNDLSRDERLSDKLSTLTNLEKLELEDCSLKEIPDGYVSDNVLLLPMYTVAGSDLVQTLCFGTSYCC